MITVGTFNLNNLFDRWNFAGALEALESGPVAVQAEFHFDDPERRRLQVDSRSRLLVAKPPADTARLAERLLAADVDVWIVQEVENADTLREFNRTHLAPAGYREVVVIDGNDATRFIDVGILSRYPLGGVTTWQRAVHPADPNRPVFSRDLIEVEVLDHRARRALTVFGTHLKSKFVDFREPDPAAASAAADLLRRRQAETIARIVAARTTPRTKYLVCGDMNDTPDSVPLAPLADGPLGLVDALQSPTEVGQVTTSIALPATTAWTATHKASGQPRRFDLIDQIWLSPALAPAQAGAWVGRRRRLERDATDHDPCWVQLDL